MTPATIKMMRELKGFLRAGAMKAYPAAIIHQDNAPASSEIVAHVSLSSQAYLYRTGLNDAAARDFLTNLIEVLAKDEAYCEELAERTAEFQAYDMQVWPGFSIRRKRQSRRAVPQQLEIHDRKFLRKLRISWDEVGV